jgi:hypothetical protein
VRTHPVLFEPTRQAALPYAPERLSGTRGKANIYARARLQAIENFKPLFLL